MKIKKFEKEKMMMIGHIKKKKRETIFRKKMVNTKESINFGCSIFQRSLCQIPPHLFGFFDIHICFHTLSLGHPHTNLRLIVIIFQKF